MSPLGSLARFGFCVLALVAGYAAGHYTDLGRVDLTLVALARHREHEAPERASHSTSDAAAAFKDAVRRELGSRERMLLSSLHGQSGPQ